MTSTRIADGFRDGPDGETIGKASWARRARYLKVIISLSTWLYINAFGPALLSGDHEQSFAFILIHDCDGLI